MEFCKPLKFDRATFTGQSFNITVRRGIKWNLCNGEDVRLWNRGGVSFGTVSIETKCMRFCDLTDDDIKYEHDPLCRSVAGLLEEMRRLYVGFDEREIVTIITFWMD